MIAADFFRRGGLDRPKVCCLQVGFVGNAYMRSAVNVETGLLWRMRPCAAKAWQKP